MPKIIDKISKNCLYCHRKILAEFLSKYNNFDSIEDKEILVNLSIKYSDFWNIDNGKTLCKSCHKLTDSYLNK